MLRRFVDLQLSGQVHAVRVPVEAADLEAYDGGEGVIARFVELYQAKFGAGTAYRQAGVEAMTFTVEATARLPVRRRSCSPPRARMRRMRCKGERPVHLAGNGIDAVAVYDAERLRPGNELPGPAVLEAEDTTVLVRSGAAAPGGRAPQPQDRARVTALPELGVALPTRDPSRRSSRRRARRRRTATRRSG